MRNIIAILGLILVVSFSGCHDIVYSPDGSYFKEIPEPEIDIQLTVTNGNELLKAWGVVKLKYDMEIRDHELISISLFVDSHVMLNTKNPDSIVFNTRTVSDGVHRMSLQLKTHSDSGSLADKLNREYMLIYIEWDMDIHNSVPSESPQIEDIEINDGRVRISWTPYNHANFGSISIYECSDAMSDQCRAIISDTDPGFWIDSTYIGGSRGYYLKLKAGTVTVKRCSIKEINISGPEIKQSEYISTTGVKLLWEKPLVYNNFSNYQIQRATDPSFGVIGQADKYLDFETVVTVEKIEDTTCTIEDIGFGSTVRYRIATAGPDGRKVVSPSETFSYGGRCSEMTSVYFSESSNSYYLIHNNDYSYRLDASSFQELARHTNRTFTIDQDFMYAYCVSGDILYLLDPLTFDTLSQLDGSLDLQNSVTRITDLVAAGSGKIFFSGWNYFYIPIAYYAYDFIEQKILGKIDHVSRVECFEKVSQNGQYGIFESLKFWKIDNLGVHHTGYIDPDNCCFIDEGEKLVETTGNFIRIRQSDDLSVISEFNTGHNLMYPTYDPVTGFVGGQSGSQYYIYNLLNQQLVKTVQLCLYSLDRFYLCNSVLFSHWGYYVAIEFP